MALTNYIPISRKIFEHRFWCEDRTYSRFEAWIDLIQMARFESGKKYVGNRVLVLNRGQVHASYRFLSDRWKWSSKKVSGFFELLIADKMIIKETQKETGQTVITICNYDKYNPIYEKEETQKETGRKRERNGKETNNNKDNKENIENIIPPIIPQTWRDNFEVYLSELKCAYRKIIEDDDFIKEREKYHPNLNVLLSIEKACTDYWVTEKAWIDKKKGKTKNIDWKTTFKNALTMKSNQVYKQKSDNQESQRTYTVLNGQ